jgi:hypothetical protein
VSGFTRLGCGLWNWEPWIALDPICRNLWLALYTSGEARRCVPGLFQGGIALIAEAARRPTEETIAALDRLLDAGMAEYDDRVRVLRLTAPVPNTPLPDAGEFPFNGNVVLGWWNKFITIPACAVRDAHVATLRWIIDAGAAVPTSKRRGGRPSGELEEKWTATFKQISIPVARRRGVRRLMDEDTSTACQPSLFAALPSRSPSLALPPGQPNQSVGTIPTTGYPQGVDNTGGSDRISVISGRLKPFGNQQVQVQEQESSFLLSGSGASSAAPDRSPPVLRLVPPPAFTPDEVNQAIATDACGLVPLVLSETRRLALQRAIPDLAAQGATLDHLRVLGAFLSVHAQTAAGWLAWIDKGDLLEALQAALEWHIAAQPGVACNP